MRWQKKKKRRIRGKVKQPISGDIKAERWIEVGEVKGFAKERNGKK